MVAISKTKIQKTFETKKAAWEWAKENLGLTMCHTLFCNHLRENRVLNGCEFTIIKPSYKKNGSAKKNYTLTASNYITNLITNCLINSGDLEKDIEDSIASIEMLLAERGKDPWKRY